MKYTAKQYVDLMSYAGGVRPMFSELFGPIIGLTDEWKAQGATERQLEMSEYAFDYVPYYTLGNLDSIDRLQEQIIEDTDEYYIALDHYGRRIKMAKATSTIPLPESYPVTDYESWNKIKHMFRNDESRLTPEMLQKAKELQEKGTLIKCEILGAFDILRELMGEVNCCIAFYEDPELINDILKTISDMNVAVLGRICKSVKIDQLSIHEDMAGNQGPLVGPNIVDEFFRDYYLASWKLVNANGTKLFCQDSDGNMNAVIDAFIACGVNIFYPCEPNGGMDIVALREKYGEKIAFRGGIDKYALRKGKEAIIQELDYKMQDKMLSGGGIVFGIDHRIPNGVTLENYIFYVNYARKKLGLPEYENSEKGWGRMAF